MNDPILEEMQRVKSPGDIKESRYRDWVTYLCALVSAKDDEIATLKAQIAPNAYEFAVKRGPGRARKAQAIHNPDQAVCGNCGQAWSAHGPTSGGIYVQCPTTAGGHV